MIVGYFENRRFDFNVFKGEIYDVRIYVENFIGRSLLFKVVIFRINSKLRRIVIRGWSKFFGKLVLKCL